MTIELVIDFSLLIMMMVTAIYIHRIEKLFATVILTGIFSLLSACLFLTMDAVDVSFTEASVGAGIATILFLGTLAQTSSNEQKTDRRPVLPLLIVSLTGLFLFFGIVDIPSFADADSPVHTYLASRYIVDSQIEIGIPNMVTSVLASYRGFDTLGEVTVIFTAGIGVLLLLGRGIEKGKG